MGRKAAARSLDQKTVNDEFVTHGKTLRGVASISR